MNNRHVAAGLAVAGVITWFAPGFNGFLFGASTVSDGDALIASAVLYVGASIVWFLRP
jgi:hypothetical protein